MTNLSRKSTQTKYLLKKIELDLPGHWEGPLALMRYQIQLPTGLYRVAYWIELELVGQKSILFHKNFQPKHQKCRRVPINLQERVNSGITKLLEEGHIEKLNNCSDQYFISPIVITVKRDQTIKLALDSKVLNKPIHKNKYQMPNIETVMDSISQIITDYKTE